MGEDALTPPPLVSELLTRCTFPAAGSALPCAVSGGADSLALLVLAAAAGCDVTAIHVDHGLRSGSGAEADVVADAARAARGTFRAPARCRWRPAPTSRPGPGRPASRPCRLTWRPGTPWTTRPRRSWSTCCAGPGRTAWRGWRRAAGTRCSACAGSRRMRCAPRWASSRCATPATPIPPSCATASATSCCRCARRWRAATPSPCWPGRRGCCVTRWRCSSGWPPRRCPTPPTPARCPPPAGRWLGVPSAAGCVRPTPTPTATTTRPRWPRSSAPSPWRGERREGRSSPAAGGCAGRAAASGSSRSAPVVSRR